MFIIWTFYFLFKFSSIFLILIYLVKYCTDDEKITYLKINYLFKKYSFLGYDGITAEKRLI